MLLQCLTSAKAGASFFKESLEGASLSYSYLKARKKTLRYYIGFDVFKEKEKATTSGL